MADYDAIVVGAGPAGGQCARDLAGRGRNVLLLERANTIGVPNFSTAGTPNETMEVFGLPESVADSPWSSILFATKRTRVELVADERMGYVLNYKLLKQFLAADAEKKGAEVLTGAVVKDVESSGGKIGGVKFEHEGEIRSASAKVVVDATGGRAVLSQKLGLLSPKKGGKWALASGIEIYMDDVEFERKGRMDFFFGKEYAPNGYTWIFPRGPGGEAKVGICSIGRINQSAMLESFVKTDPQLKDAKKTESHGGSMYIMLPNGIRECVMDGLIAVGDAAAQINPVAGEGIRHAMYSGRFAAQTIEEALAAGSCGKDRLQKYDRLWREYSLDKWKSSLVLAALLYTYPLGQGGVDMAIKGLRRKDPKVAINDIFNYNLSAKLKVLKMFSRFMGV